MRGTGSGGPGLEGGLFGREEAGHLRAEVSPGGGEGLAVQTWRRRPAARRSERGEAESGWDGWAGAGRGGAGRAWARAPAAQVPCPARPAPLLGSRHSAPREGAGKGVPSAEPRCGLRPAARRHLVRGGRGRGRDGREGGELQGQPPGTRALIGSFERPHTHPPGGGDSESPPPEALTGADRPRRVLWPRPRDSSWAWGRPRLLVLTGRSPGSRGSGGGHRAPMWGTQDQGQGTCSPRGCRSLAFWAGSYLFGCGLVVTASELDSGIAPPPRTVPRTPLFIQRFIY